MKNDMKKRLDIEPYFQTSCTCGPAALLTVLHYHKPIEYPLSQQKEMEIWEVSRAGNLRNCTIAGLAKYALMHDFEAKLHHKHNEGYIYHPSMNREKFEESMKYYKKCRQEAEELGLEVEISDFEIENLLHYVDEGKPPLILSLFSSGVLHYYVMSGYGSKRVEIIDPLGGHRKINKKTLDWKIDLPYGKSALAVWPKKLLK